MKSQCIIFAANRGNALTSSRTLLIRHFLSVGWQVALATADDKESRSLREMGAHLEPVVFNRGGFSPLSDIKAYQRLRAIYKKRRPDLIQLFHAKPVILGTLAARHELKESVRIISTITGLGHAFISGGTTARMAGMGYGLARTRSDRTVFQNTDDRTLFVHRGWVDQDKARLIRGSGVDLDRFAMAERPDRGNQPPVVVMLGRLLRQKGIPEFVEVAGRIKQKWPQARFLLAGEEDPVHPDAVAVRWVQEQGSVEYLGRLSDVQPLLAKADLLLFPSYYREGLPRVILEAAATGLPTVAFDVPGVREAVRDGETGYLVSFRDLDGLTDRVKTLLENREKRLHMGRAAREMVENEFDVRGVKERYLDVYRELGVEV
jgi:glycosyltransferase involved in cell wall biosynthesis